MTPSQDNVMKFLLFFIGRCTMDYYLFEKIMKIKPQARADQLPSPF